MIDVGTARLATTDLAPGGEPKGTVVALHAGVADRRAWRACTPRWVADGWRVVTYDRRGFGASEWEVAEFDIGDDLVGVLDARSIDRAVLVGNSMGGALAIDTALAHPDRVRALVLVGTAVSGQTDNLAEPTEAERSLALAMDNSDRNGDLAQLNRLETHYWLDGPDVPEGRVTGEVRQLFGEMNARALSAPDTGNWADAVPAWDRLQEIAVPTLVVVGVLDESDVVAVGHHVAARIPRAELLELANSAHLPMLDDPEGFCGAVAAFLGRLPEE